MILTGFTDEVSPDLDKQLAACARLGWNWIDLRTVGDKNICALRREEMRLLLDKLAEKRLRITSFGSPLANWSRSLDYPLEQELQELEHAASLMHMGGVKGIRVMSYKTDAPGPVDGDFGKAAAARLRELSVAAEHLGVVLLHENCETWGGQSPDHTLRLLEEVASPAFRLIFDTGNPPGNLDVRGEEPYSPQKGPDFLKAVYEAVEMVHIKDARIGPEGEVVYTWPGEGEGGLPEIFAYLKERDYQGPFSIEPHLAVVYHDESVCSDEGYRRDSFLEYAARSRRLLEQAGFTAFE